MKFLSDFLQRNLFSLAPIFKATLSNPIGAAKASILGRGEGAAKFYQQASGLTKNQATKDWLGEMSEMSLKPWKDMSAFEKGMNVIGPASNVAFLGGAASELADGIMDPNKSLSGTLLRTGANLTPFALNLPMTANIGAMLGTSAISEPLANYLDSATRLR